MTLCLSASGGEQDVDLLIDRGFQTGDGVYETLRVEDGAVLWLEEHIERLKVSALKIRLPFPWDVKSVALFLRPRLPEQGLARLRLTLTAGEGGRGFVRPAVLSPRLFALCVSASATPSLEDLEVAPHRVPLDWPAKTLSGLPRVLAAPPVGREWVMVNEGGQVTEATMSNIFWWKSGSWQTPAITPSLLSGLTRQRVIQLAHSMGLAMEEGTYTVEELRQAEEVMLTGSVAGLVAAKKLEGRALQTRHVEQLREGYQNLVKNEVSRSKTTYFY
ncbi:MAG: aminotransferase class IV [Planctomycetota bacterium]